MRKLSIFASTALVFAAVAPSQFTCPLGQPLTSPNQGNIGGGLYFNVTVTTTVTWNSIQYVASDGSTAGNSSLELYVGPSTWVGNVLVNPGPWKLVGQTVPVAIPGAADTPVVGVLQPAGANPGTITFGPGSYGVALRAIGHSWGYQNGVFNFPAPGGEFTVTTGGASNAFLTGPTFTPRSINGNIDYGVGGTPMPFAAAQSYGPGCYDLKQSFYELMGSTATNQDLSNTSFKLTLDAGNNRYAVTAGTTPVDTASVVSTPLVFPNDDADVLINLPGPPMLWPDTGGVIGTSPIDPVTGQPIAEVNANGYINFVPGTNNPPLASPTVANFLAGGPRFGNHIDLDPTIGGTVNFDFNGTEYLWTWQNVPTFFIGATSFNTMQIAYEVATGNIEMRYGAMDLQCGGTCPTLVGFTPGGGAMDPGSIDLNVSFPFSTDGIDNAPLTLTASGAPITGSTTTLTTSNPSVSPGIGICFFSVNQASPPIDLTFILGLPNCFANIASLDLGVVIDNIPINGMAVNFPIPSTPGVAGQSFYVQSIWLDGAANAGGIITSNGVRLLIGIF